MTNKRDEFNTGQMYRRAVAAWQQPKVRWTVIIVLGAAHAVAARAAPRSAVLIVVVVVVVVVVMVVLPKTSSKDAPAKATDVLVEWNLKGGLQDAMGGSLIKNDAETIPRPPPGRRMPPLDAFNRTGQVNTPLARWEPRPYSAAIAQSGCIAAMPLSGAPAAVLVVVRDG